TTGLYALSLHDALPILPKLTRATVTKTFSGDIAGEGHVEYLMMYRSDGSATFVGLKRVVGRVAGKAGSFVLQRTGVFESGAAKRSEEHTSELQSRGHLV